MILPDAIFDELGKVKHARAFLLTGSRATGKASSNSDWDLFVVLERGRPHWRKTWRVGESWLEVFCHDEEQVRALFQSDAWEGKGVLIGMFCAGQAVKDSEDGVLLRLRQRARRLWRKGPRELSREQRSRIDYTVATYLQDIEDCLRDGNRADLIINQALWEFVQCYYRLQRQWLPRPKDWLADLESTAPHYWSIADRVGRVGDWRERGTLVIEPGRSLAEQFCLTLSGEFYDPPKRTPGE